MPYATDFNLSPSDHWNIKGAANSNIWTIGTPQNMPIFPHALFIKAPGSSNDSLATYRTYTSSISYAEKYLKLGEEDSLHIEFLVEAHAIPNSAFLKVYLCPTAIEYNNSNNYNAPFTDINKPDYAVALEPITSNYYLDTCETQSKVSATIVNPAKNKNARLVFMWINRAGYFLEKPSISISNLTICDANEEPSCLPVYSLAYDTICIGDTLQFADAYYTEEGQHQYLTTNESGCDSIILIDLAFRPQKDTIITKVTMNNGEQFYWYDNFYDSTGVYTIALEDQWGCTYYETLMLTVITSSLQSVDEQDIRLLLSPNPTSGNTILNVEGLNQEADIILSDTQARRLLTLKLPKNQTSIEIPSAHLDSGVYYIKLIGQDFIHTEKLIKQ